MDYTPFSKRPRWKDVAPIPQDDGPAPVVAINYLPQFRDTMDYFRAVLASNEHSKRAFDLTSEVIQLNAANYTAWRFRRQCLNALADETLWKLEFAFLEERLEENPKNYQIWFHRQRVVLHLKDYSREKADLRAVFMEDAKNYHAWTHRQWVVRTFELWDGELEFIDELLKLDVRNNSLWSHRWFVVTKLQPIDKVPKHILLREMEFALKHTATAVHNESSWSYLSGLLRGRSLSDFPTVEKALAAMQVDHADKKAVPMLALFFDLAVAEGTAAGNTRAVQLCDQLASIDAARKKYWQMCKAECTAPAAASTATTSTPASSSAPTSSPAAAASAATADPVEATTATAASGDDGSAMPPPVE